MGDIVQMKGITKTFGRVQALRNVDFNVKENEIVGLLGDNGAGKSTLIKILSGVLRPDKGEIYLKGEKVHIRDTNDAIKHGIETIYQDSALVTQLSIARNLFLGREPTRGPRFLNWMDQDASSSWTSRRTTSALRKRRVYSASCAMRVHRATPVC